MNISVFGLGYVGCVTAVCFAKEGNSVVGVDVDERKVASVSAGVAPFYEPHLEDLLCEVVGSGHFSATTNEGEALDKSQVAVVCVGTPSDERGAIALDQVRAVLTTIAERVRARSGYFVIVLRSTVLPNAVEEELIPLVEHVSGKAVGVEIGFCYNPEFLREGSAIRDFYEAPLFVLGASDERTAATVSALYKAVHVPPTLTDIRTAALVKYTCNIFHALKVSFANEVGRVSETMGVDAHRLMDIVCQDTKLNIAPTYLKPGLAFGGSCLPKDLRALLVETRKIGLQLPLLDSVLPSNETHLKECIRTVLRTGCRKIGLIGLTFKEGTDDLRESPAVQVAETLIGKGCDLAIYEPAIAPGSIYGRNLAYVEHSIPHIWKLLSKDLEAVVRRSDVVVVLRKLDRIERACFAALRDDQICIDMAGVFYQVALQCGRLILFGAPESHGARAAAAYASQGHNPTTL